MKKMLTMVVVAASLMFVNSSVFAGNGPSKNSELDDSGVTSTRCTVQDPQVFTQNVIDTKVLAILKAAQDNNGGKLDQKKVQNSVEEALKPYIAIKQMCTFGAGPLYTKASPEDQAAFEEVFYQFIASLYGGALQDFDNQKVVVYKQRTNDWETAQKVLVHSVIKSNNGGPDTPVAFVLYKEGCKWLFADFIVENISAMGNIQAQLRYLIQNGHSTLPDLTKLLVAKNLGEK